MQSERSIPLPVRTEFGFTRTNCDCQTCVLNCKHIPGFLIPHDLYRIVKEHGAEERVLEWAEENLLASPGFVAMKDGALFRIPTLVPARKREDRSCKFLTGDERCSLHRVSPYGCSFFDVHMSKTEADRRSDMGARAVMADWLEGGPYSRIWQHLDAAGLRNDPPELSRQRLQYSLDHGLSVTESA